MLQSSAKAFLVLSHPKTQLIEEIVVTDIFKGFCKKVSFFFGQNSDQILF